MKEYVMKPGDENKTTATVEGAEEYTVGQALDCQFTVVDTAGFEARKKDANVDITIFGKFNHRCDAEEYARWLHSGKTANKEFSTDDFKKSVTEEAVRVLKETISYACTYFMRYGRMDARKEILKHLGLDSVFEVLDKGEPEFNGELCEQSMRDAIGKLFNS